MRCSSEPRPAAGGRRSTCFSRRAACRGTRDIEPTDAGTGQPDVGVVSPGGSGPGDASDDGTLGSDGHHGEQLGLALRVGEDRTRQRRVGELA
jgi:hypothetical protein